MLQKRLGRLQVIISVVARLRFSSNSLSVVNSIVLHVEAVVVPVKQAIVVMVSIIASVRTIGIAIETVTVKGGCTHFTMLAIRVVAVAVAPAKIRIRDIIVTVLRIPGSSRPVVEVEALLTLTLFVLVLGFLSLSSPLVEELLHVRHAER